MVSRRLKPENFEIIKKDLIENTKCSLNEQFYSLTMQINKIDYILKIQFADTNKIILWDALEINNNTYDKNEYMIIKNDRILMAMLDIILYQKTKMFIN